MRVALVNNLYVDQLGYFYIASALKAAGHEVRFFLTGRSLERELVAYDPQLVGLTAVTGNHLWAANTAWQIKQLLPEAKTILGGPHPTYHPQVLLHRGLDFICRGEGEVPVVELCARLEAGRDPWDIPGIDAKQGEHVHRNGFAQLVEDLDSIPFPDRSIYGDYATFARKNQYPFLLSSRGCPYQCTFCYAPTLAKLTKDEGKFVRFRSVDNVIAEALQLKAEYDVRSVEFVDDIFGMKRSWLHEFAEKWPAQVGLPFQCNLRADLVSEESIEPLVRAGCEMVAFGVESGSERMRNEVLQKTVTRAEIIEAARLLRAHGIRVVTYNIVGAPTETWEETLETLRLNQEIQPDYAQVSIMQPYPGTEIHEIAVRERQLVDSEQEFDEIEPFNYGSTPLRLPHRREVANLQKFFYLAVRFPRLTPLVLQLVKLPENRLFYLAFLAIHLWGFHLRVKRVPATFLLQLSLNVKEILRRHRSGLYRRHLHERSDAPRLKDRIESGAGL